MRFSWGFDEEADQCRQMKQELLQQIMALRQTGVTQFMVACDPGVGLYAAEEINVLRQTDSELQLFCVTPYEEQANKWAPYLRERYFDILIKCTHISAVNQRKTPAAQIDAYKTIINLSQVVLAIYDPASYRGDAVDQAIDYAIELEIPVIAIHPDTLSCMVLSPRQGNILH